MIQKILPAYGKVLIIDDKYEDVIPIQNILAENGVPYIFYDYTVFKDIEVKRVDAVRMVFLDIRLEDGIQGPKNIATVLAAVIEKVIQPKNGPYAVVLWTNEIALKEEIQGYLLSYLSTEETTLPTYICALDKKEFVAKPKEVLTESLSLQLQEQKMMNFLTEWENQSISISSNMVRLLLYGLHTKMDDESIQKIFIQMATLENSEVKNKLEATRNILQILVEFLRDRYLEIMSNPKLIKDFSEYWDFDFNNECEIKRIQENTSIEQEACINSLLNINTYDSKDRQLPGKIVLLADEAIEFDINDFKKSSLSDKWYDNNVLEACGERIQLILKPVEVDITPNCDYAQNKNHMLRTVFGYMIEIGQVDKDGEMMWINYRYANKFRHKISNEYVYVTPELLVNEKLCVFVFNTKYMSIENKDYCDRYQYLFRFNNDIVSEIRKKAGDNITRFGINNL